MGTIERKQCPRSTLSSASSSSPLRLLPRPTLAPAATPPATPLPPPPAQSPSLSKSPLASRQRSTPATSKPSWRLLTASPSASTPRPAPLASRLGAVCPPPPLAAQQLSPSWPLCLPPSLPARSLLPLACPPPCSTTLSPVPRLPWVRHTPALPFPSLECQPRPSLAPPLQVLRNSRSAWLALPSWSWPCGTKSRVPPVQATSHRKRWHAADHRTSPVYFRRDPGTDHRHVERGVRVR